LRVNLKPNHDNAFIVGVNHAFIDPPSAKHTVLQYYCTSASRRPSWSRQVASDLYTDGLRVNQSTVPAHGLTGAVRGGDRRRESAQESGIRPAHGRGVWRSRTERASQSHTRAGRSHIPAPAPRAANPASRSDASLRKPNPYPESETTLARKIVKSVSAPDL